MKHLSLSVIGLGYIGLPTATLFAMQGLTVVGVDVSPSVVATINKGKIHIIEPDLDHRVHQVVAQQLLRATTTPVSTDVYIIAVPTPFQDDHVPDLSYIKSAIQTIAEVIQPGNLIILESTSPVGTTEKIAQWLQQARPDLAIPGFSSAPTVCIAHCPERVLPGKVMHELIYNDRVIGGLTPQCTAAATAFYQLVVKGEIFATDARTAEMCKLTENAFRDVNIAFANELANIAEKLDIDAWELIKLANHHPRVNILNPGPGVGGHCIAVDPWFIINSAPQDALLIKTARTVNDDKPRRVINKIKKAIKETADPVLAVFGLSFKANIDDLRESPAVTITKALAGLTQRDILVVEPHINLLPQSLLNLGGFSLTPLLEALEQANILVLLVDHDQFKNISSLQLTDKQLIDTRGIWSQTITQSKLICVE